MGKVVAGQLKLWEMVREFSQMSKSSASQTMRLLIDSQAKAQQTAPDVLPDSITLRPMIESETGKIITSIT